MKYLVNCFLNGSVLFIIPSIKGPQNYSIVVLLLWNSYPRILWPERTETNSQSFSFQGANLGQIQGFHLLCKIYKLWNPGNRVLYVLCKGKRLQGSTRAACTAYQRQLQGHLCFSLCTRMYEQCTLLLSPRMQATVKEREKLLLQPWPKYIYVCILSHKVIMWKLINEYSWFI